MMCVFYLHLYLPSPFGAVRMFQFSKVSGRELDLVDTLENTKFLDQITGKNKKDIQ